MQSYDGSLAIIPEIFWLSNAQEMFSFVSLVEKGKPHNNCLDWKIRMSILRHDLDSLVYNIYQSFIRKIKRHLALMVIPAIIEAQPLPGFFTEDKSAWPITSFMKLTLGTESPPGRTYTTMDIIDLFDSLWKCFEEFFVELVIVKNVFSELLDLINRVAFNDLVRRTNFCSFKRGTYAQCLVYPLKDLERSPDFAGLQIQYNLQRIEGEKIGTWRLHISDHNFLEWCRSHDMTDDLHLLRHIQQATKIGLMRMVGIFPHQQPYATNPEPFSLVAIPRRRSSHL